MKVRSQCGFLNIVPQVEEIKCLGAFNKLTKLIVLFLFFSANLLRELVG